MACFKLILSLPFLYFSSIQALQITKETRSDVRVRIGQPFDIGCVVDSTEWDFCKWKNKKIDKSCLVISGEAKNCTAQNEGRQRVFSYPLYENQCTLRISDAALEDAAQWECIMARDQVSVQAFVNVTVYHPTNLQFKTRPNRAYQAGIDADIECVGEGGYPPPKLVAYVGPTEELNKNHETLISKDTREVWNEDTGAIDYLAVFNFVPRVDQQYHYIKCEALQSDAVNGQVEDIFQPRVIASQFEVHFKPTIDGPSSFSSKVGDFKEIVLSFKANPTPTDEQIIWHIVPQNHEQSLTITPGIEAGRYIATPLQQNTEDPSIFQTSLRINPVELIDFNMRIYLEVINEFGTSTYDVLLTLQEEEITATEETPSGQTSGGVIVASVILGILIVSFSVGASIYLCKYKKVLCFAENQAPGVRLEVQLQENHTVNQNVSRLENGENSELMSKSGGYQSRDEVDSDIAMVRHPHFNGKSPGRTNRTESYKEATLNKGESLPPKWPEDSKN